MDENIAVMEMNKESEGEKRRLALISVAVAVFLTTLKLVVGLWTGSLGILSEAADSSLDLVAALITFFALRVSDKPADASHTYGHGKVENFSALVETALLLITCGLIVHEAIQRLFFKTVKIEAGTWVFGIMVMSIGIDLLLSQALRRAARKYHSQVLEASALRFGMDVWTSAVVIFGLIMVRVGQVIGQEELLSRADSVAALGVVLAVVYAGLQLGRQAVAVLLDAAPAGLPQRIEGRVRDIAGVRDVHQVRVRQAGPETFVDMTVLVDRNLSFEEAHAVATAIENAVQDLVPRADVLVHIDPATGEGEGLVEKIRAVAARQELRVHGLRLHDIRGEHLLELHVEVNEGLSLKEAHDRVSHFEAEIMAQVEHLTRINSHIEPAGKADEEQAIEVDVDLIRQEVEQIADRLYGVDHPHQVSVRRVGDELNVSFHCVTNPDLSVKEAHELTEQAESRLRERFPQLGSVLIHIEPPEGN